ncbi:MvaI/BcnI family restriction endonuclease [Candidatus Desulfovibrio trichonymphae]
MEDGKIFVDFDARTQHNHGTKFRISQKYIPELYAESINY